MNPLNQLLRKTFLFYSRDLLANRAGRLSERQQARQQAAGVSLRLGMTVFIIIMLGTLGVIAFASLQSGTSQSLTDPEMLTTLGIAGGVIGMIILLSYLFSGRNYIQAAKATQVKVAEGEAQRGKIKEDSAHFELKLGKTKIRLVMLEQLDAFEVGTAYRVYYLPGPIPTILSGEVIGTEDEANQFSESEVPLEKDKVLQGHSNARPVVIVLAVLTLGIPLALFAAASLSGILRLVVMVVLFGVSFGFVFWALRRTSS